MKKTFIFALIMTLTPLAFAKGPGGKHGGMKVFKELNLNAEQKEQIKAIRQANKDKMKSLREKAKTDREAFKSAMESEASKSKLVSLRKKMVKSKQALKDQQFENMLEIREILNPEQRAKFRELKSEMKGKRRHGDFDE
jgi:Spy/CpxP family protein refolding chaperone